MRTMPGSSPGVQPLRPWSALLRQWLRKYYPSKPPTRGGRALPAKPHRATHACCAHAPVAQAPRGHSKDSDASRFPGYPCRCCTTSQRITCGNLARFTGPTTTMQPYRPGFHCTAHRLQHPNQHARTAVALPLVSIILSSTGAPRLSSPQQVGA